MTKLEEIAQAMLDKYCDLETPEGVEAWPLIARAAVEAMREPSEAMVQQFVSVQYGVYGDVEAKAIFQKMIDAILNEKPE